MLRKEKATVSKKEGKRDQMWACCICFLTLDLLEIPFYTRAKDPDPRRGKERMIRTHKIRLHPTPEQAQYFARAAGVARFVWNWALAEWNRQYEAGERPTALNLKKHFNQIRREHFPWTEGASPRTPLTSPFLISTRHLRLFLRAVRAVQSSRARSVANQASISPTISLS